MYTWEQDKAITAEAMAFFERLSEPVNPEQRAEFRALSLKYPGEPEGTQEDRNRRFGAGEFREPSPVTLALSEAHRLGTISDAQYAALIS